jgi:hypothetical protein
MLIGRGMSLALYADIKASLSRDRLDEASMVC